MSMSPERMCKIAQDVCDYADVHGIPRDKEVDEVAEDIEFAIEFGAPDVVRYLYDYIGCEEGAMWDEVQEVRDAAL